MRYALGTLMFGVGVVVMVAAGVASLLTIFALVTLNLMPALIWFGTALVLGGLQFVLIGGGLSLRDPD